jgi:hypothetical protein
MVQDGKKRTGISLVKVVLSDDDEDKDSYSDVCSNEVYNAAATKPILTAASMREQRSQHQQQLTRNQQTHRRMKTTT